MEPVGNYTKVSDTFVYFFWGECLGILYESLVLGGFYSALYIIYNKRFGGLKKKL